VLDASRPLRLRTIPRAAVFLAVLTQGCGEFGDGPSLSRKAQREVMSVGQYEPATAESAVVGAAEGHIRRNSPAYLELVRCDAEHVVFKDEENSGADRMTTPRLCAALRRLGQGVSREWPGLKLRVTEAWDERREHGKSSVHYEGRAADVTVSDVDSRKLGRLARLAVSAGLDWVFYEDGSHVHVSVRRADADALSRRSAQ
jgi:hypothetical protein